MQHKGLAGAISAPQPEAQVGTLGGALFLPGSQSAASCRVTVAYLAPQPGDPGLDRWPEPVAVHEVAADVAEAARHALAAALHVLLYVAPGDQPPVPAPLYYAIESDEVSEDTIASTAGNSLGLPLALAFLSALSDLPIPAGVGATGAVSAPQAIGTVGFVDAKRRAHQNKYGDSAPFYTPDTAATLSAVAAGIESEAWRQRFPPATKTDAGALADVSGRNYGRDRRSVESADFVPIPGTATFLWAEVENAAGLWQSHKAVFRLALDAYESILRDAIRRHGGQLFAAQAGPGEAIGAAFSDAASACHAGIAALRTIRSAIWPAALGRALPVRIGIHRGDADRNSEGWRGVGPSGAACIAAVASGGQLLATESVHAESEFGQGISWVSLGAYRLRDLAEAVEVWQVGADGLPSTFAPLQSLDTRRHNLPTYDTPLIGRDADVTSLVELLGKERLVSLTGPGGVGKTRLALTAAASVLTQNEPGGRFDDGAFFVSLEATEPTVESLAAAIADAAGVRLARPDNGANSLDIETDSEFTTALTSVLGERRLLLVLDNAEAAHTPVVSVVRELLAGSPHIVVLVTSRVPLRLESEIRFAVAPLALPEEGGDAASWGEASAIQLFVSRARSVDDRFFATNESDRNAVTRICARLDGLPLAIELAAARTRLLSLADIESRLTASLKLLANRQADVPERQRTLLATLEWSYELLKPAEAQLLRRASVFAGGFTAEAAEAIHEDDPDTLDFLEALEENSLVVCRRAASGDPPRFSLLQTVIDFAAAKLAGDTGEKTDAQKAHAGYFVSLAKRLGMREQRRAADEANDFDALDRDMANLRTAWTFLNTSNAFRIQADLTANLAVFLRRRGHARERLSWIPGSLQASVGGDTPPSVLAGLHQAYALALQDRGDLEGADCEAQKLLEIGRRMDDSDRIADALALRGSLATWAKRYEDADHYFDKALPLYLESQNARGIAAVSNNRALNAGRAGDLERSERLYNEALTVCRRIGDEHGAAYAHCALGSLAERRGDYVSSRDHYIPYLTYCRARRDTVGVAVALFNLGEIALYQGNDEGLILFVAAEELFDRLGNRFIEQVRAGIELWENRRGTGARQLVDEKRREFSRRSIEFLRTISLPEEQVRPPIPRRIAL